MLEHEHMRFCFVISNENTAKVSKEISAPRYRWHSLQRGLSKCINWELHCDKFKTIFPETTRTLLLSEFHKLTAGFVK